MAQEIGKLTIQSTTFRNNSPIPPKYTCQGKDVSPPLSITGAPSATVSFAIIMDDPDAPVGVFDHWIAWNISPTTTNLAEGASVPLEGKNGFGVNRYRGPCPPPGKPHRYFFKVFALDQNIDLPSGSTKQQLLKAIEGHVLAQGELMGTFKR